MFRTTLRILAALVLLLSPLESLAVPGAGPSTSSRPAIPPQSAALPQAASNPHVFSNAAHRNTPTSHTTAARPTVALPEGKNFPGVQNVDVVLPGHEPSDSAWVCASITADVDGDGYPDVVTAQFDGTLNVLLNPGARGVQANWNNTVNKSAYVPNVSFYAGGIDYMYAADLNGDKRLDVITVNYAARTIFVYLNTGGGNFAKATPYPLGFQFETGFVSASGGLAIGDVNGDGFPDIVALGVQQFTPDSSSSSVEALTLINREDGTFGDAQAGAVSVIPGWPVATYSSLKLQDVTGDGTPDLVFVGAVDSTLFLNVVPGTQNFVFDNPLPSLPSSQLSGYSIVGLGSEILLQDFDGDGTIDALFQEGSDIFLAKGHGAGAFDPPASVLSSLGSPQSTTFADINGDGILDAIVYGNAVTSIYTGTGKGAFSTTPSVFPGGSRATLGMGDREVPAPSDMDGDGKLDLLQLDTDTGLLGISLNSETGFHTPQVVVPDPSKYNGMFSSGVAAIHSPGTLDLVAIPDEVGLPYDISRPVIAVANDGAGNFLPTAYHILLTSDQTSNVNTLVSSKAVAGLVDMNGDGLADILLTSGAIGDEVIGGGLALSPNQGGYVFGDPQRLTNQTFALSCDLERTAIGDLNHDQKPDFVVTYRGNNCQNAYSFPGLPAGFLTYLSQPDGSYIGAFFAYGSFPFIPVLADVNGDGNLDLIIGESDDYQTSGAAVIPGNPDGSFNLGAAATILPSTSQVSSITAGDFDGDGKMDLAIGVLAQLDSNGNPVDNTTGLLVMKGNGDFTFNRGSWYLPGNQVWAGRSTDFDGDGHPDLALNVTTGVVNGYSSSTDGSVPEPGLVLLPNIGAGIFGTPQPIFGTTSVIGGSIPSPPVDGSLQVADLNGDGAPDVLNDNAFYPNIYLNTGAVKLSLSISAASIAQGSTTTLTASLVPTVSQQAPTGTISFFADKTLLGTASVESSKASLDLANLAPGSYTITAQYSGDAHFNQAAASTSLALTVSPLTPDFNFAAPSPANLSLAAGQAGTVTLAVTGNATFNGTVTFACQGAAAKMQCLVSPGSLSLTPGKAATVTVAVSTQGQASAMAHNPLDGWKPLTGGFSLAGLFLIALSRKRRNLLANLCMLMIVTGLALTMTGCGGSNHSDTTHSDTAAGTYSLTITATANGLTHSQTLPITITNSK